MNLDDIVLDGVATMPVRHPTTGEQLTMPDGRPMQIQLVGQDSKQYRAAMAEYQQRISRRGPRRLGGTPTDIEDHVVNLLSHCTVGWILAYGGGEVPYSHDEARALYANPRYRWVRDQVDEFVNDRANFLGESSAA